MPPVRLHDLRHGAASLAHTAGTNLKTVQDQLEHASIVLTADTYTSVLPAAQHKAAEATARLILTTARNARAKMTAKNRRRRPGPRRGPPRRPPHHPALTPRPASKPQVIHEGAGPVKCSVAGWLVLFALVPGCRSPCGGRAAGVKLRWPS
ncbi:hypothetical protein [Actinoplanes sp. NPDC026623]|uniref:hypothetical protein n=1 Tax=Actinoplanes sp. NPDC026623 TaxID=3155610 RepID=UPI0033E14026